MNKIINIRYLTILDINRKQLKFSLGILTINLTIDNENIEI